MLIFTYLSRRFVSYVVVISLLLAFLFNFVEFFEKLMRVKHATVRLIIHFLQLNFLPSWFDVMPLAVWLGTCFLIKELNQRSEWELLQLLSFIPRRFLWFLVAMGAFLSLSVLVVRESYIVDLSSQADRFKHEKFKQETTQKIISKWLELDCDRLGYFSILDLDQLQGQDLMVITMSPTFTLQNVMTARHFTINPSENIIIARQAKVVTMEGQEEQMVESLSLRSPGFFSQIRMSLESPTLSNLGHKIALYRDFLPPGVYRELLYTFFSRLSYYFQLLLYPALTFCLFMVTQHVYMRWLLAFTPYPLFIIAGVATDYAFRAGGHPGIVVLPYFLLLLFLCLFCTMRIIRRS